MARTAFRGDALPVAQVNTLVFAGTWEANDIIQVKIGNKTWNRTSGSATIATVLSTLVTAWLALDDDTYPEFAEITPSADSTTLTLTAATAGVPFTCTLQVFESDGTTPDTDATIAGVNTATEGTAATASAGPNHWNTASNWTGLAVPTTEDVDIENSNVDILYGLSNAGSTLASLNIGRTYTGKIGLPRWNENGYFEYRTTDLTVDATLVNVGYGENGGGSGRIKLNNGTVQTTVNVYFTGTEAEDGIPALLWRGTNASNALNVNRGFVGAGFFAGQAYTLATLNIGYIESRADDSNVILGNTGTMSACATVMTGGNLKNFSATSSTSTLVMYDGEAELEGTVGHVGLSIRGGHCWYNTTGTLGGNTIVAGTGILDFSADLRAKTVTNAIDVYDGASVQDPFKLVSSLVVDFNHGSDPTLSDLGVNYRVTRGATA